MEIPLAVLKQNVLGSDGRADEVVACMEIPLAVLKLVRISPFDANARLHAWKYRLRY